MRAEAAGSGFAPGVYLADDDRRRRKPARSGRRWLLAALLVVGAAVVLLGRRGEETHLPAASPTAFSRIGFVADEALPPMLAYRQTEAGRANVHYRARIRPADADRWDTLTVGDLAGEEALFQVTLYAAKSAMAKPGLFVDLARQSAELDAAIVYAASPQSLETARGAFETAEVRLSGAKGERPCLGFRLNSSPRFDLFGLACGAGGAMLDQATLGRLIERLAPTALGTETGLGEILKNAAS
jgi:hypothetical protein